ncbi:MBL fold metallo-hydrolase [Rossellomorea aquimaris]|uniref:MBL fold metallo-hydrolase n=1 Tax=Rossellomorea aquimaris TaxID=189382 RepID=UPI001CD1F09B|nr:MBL fold metallo-hydrolase [Rossellomorea aquimaris]MCA1054735.1 MBL fold metallo-hydrolase [Rossellomorea aquimaris]
MSITSFVNNIAKITLSTPYAVGDVNVYLIKGDVLTLVDAGPLTETAWGQLSAALATLGYSPGDIEQIVLTHHHPDHAGMLERFSESVKIIGHPYNQYWINRDEYFHRVYDDFFYRLGVESGLPEAYLSAVSKFKSPLKYMGNRALDGVVMEGEALPGLPDWKVIETLGHAQSHLSFFRESDGVMIAGDHILAHISPNPIIEPPFEGGIERSKPLLQYNRSLMKLMDIPVSFAYTGHGKEVEDVHGLIPKRMAKQEERAKAVLEMVQGKRQTVFELCRHLFPAVYKKELGLTLSETIGQLDYLESLGSIRKEKGDSAFHYYA